LPGRSTRGRLGTANAKAIAAFGENSLPGRMSVSVSQPKQSIEPKLPPNFKPHMLSFDVYGTLIYTPPANLRAFRAILADAGRSDLDPQEFYSFWEQRNIVHYYEPYRTYKDICRLSLLESYSQFGVTTGRVDAINQYFDCFSSMELYPDALPTLGALARTHKLALVSNIDDDLLSATPLGREFDLVCTAERAHGYKPDGTLFRYLLDHSGVTAEQILHSGQSQFTDMVGGKPLGLTVAWINRCNLDLSPKVPRPDFIFHGLEPLRDLLTQY
jgi:2-haloacid dehalogenase